VTLVLCPILVRRPFVLRPFELTSLANLHHLLFCAMLFWFDMFWLTAFSYTNTLFLIIFDLHLFVLSPLFPGTQLERKTRPGCRLGLWDPFEQDRQCTHIEACLRNHCYRVKAIIIIYSECVSVALVIRHAKRMRRIILSNVASLYGCTVFLHMMS
jgi:hypothetical protein